MKLFWSTFILIFLLFLSTDCTNEKGKSTIPILHPNVDSELTLLMREMYDYYDDLKIDIEKGTRPDDLRDFKAIHNAVATQPSKSESTLYQAMSKVYLESAERLNSSNSDLPVVFNAMIDNCMNCHQQMCPGPMVKIKKLYVRTER